MYTPALSTPSPPVDPALLTPSDVAYSESLQKHLVLFSEILSSSLPSSASASPSPSYSSNTSGTTPNTIPNTTSSISTLITSSPTASVPTALALATYAVAKARPTHTDRVLGIVQSALDDDAVRGVVIVDDVERIPEDVFYVFERELGERVGEDMVLRSVRRGRKGGGLNEDADMEEGRGEEEGKEEEEETQSANEENGLVKAALVQSFAARLGLTDSLHHIHIARRGLGLSVPPHPAPEDPITKEIFATAALVVFLTLGAADAARAIAAAEGGGGGSYQGVFSALMSVRRSGVLKSWAALSALDRVILNVEGQTNERRSAEEVWGALFP